MASEFDAAELFKVFQTGAAAHHVLALRVSSGLLAVAAYVREQTLREAATICGELGTKHWDNHKGRGDAGLRADPNEQGMSLGADECEEALNELAANCQGKLDGSVVKESLTTAASPGERDGGKC
jgi:hypothetical protein